MKQLIFLFSVISLVSLTLSSCRKVEEKQLFTETTYIPENMDIAKQKVLEFLSFAVPKGIQQRTNFPNTEVNLGRWILEGSGNYGMNMNYPGSTIKEFKEYSFDLENLVENGILKMDGAEMSTKFVEFINSVTSHETQTGTKALGTDIVFVNVSNTRTYLKAKVVYGEQIGQNSNPLLTWSEASLELTYILFDRFDWQQNPTGCAVWWPETFIDILPTFSPTCTTNGLICMRGVEQYPPTTDEYNSDWLEEDANAAAAIALEYVHRLNNPSGGLLPEYPYSLKGVSIAWGYGPIYDQNIHIGTRRWHEVGGYFVTSYGDCP